MSDFAETELVEAIPASPPRREVALTDLALPPPPGDPARAATNGVRWRPANVGVGGIQDPCNVSAMVPSANLAPQLADAFLLWEAEKCTTAQDQNVADAQARAMQLLEATTSKRIAKEFWRGDLVVAAGWSNPFLTRDAAAGSNAPVVGKVAAGVAVAPAPALAALEEAIGEKGTGARGMIHCTRRTATLWAREFLVQREGGVLVTALGTIVIPDAGYDGSAPGAGTTLHHAAAPDATGVTNWAYATGLVTLRLSEIEVSGAQRPNDPQVPHMNSADAETISRDAGSYGPNDRIVIATRYAVVTMDPAILVGVNIDHSSTTAFSATLP